MKLSVDRERCEGHAMCESIAPELFRVDDDFKSTVIKQPSTKEEIDAARLAVESCPMAAISFDE